MSGDPNAERVIVMMGSGCETAEETVDSLCKRGEKVGLLKVRLYRPFSVSHFIGASARFDKSDRRARSDQRAGSTGEPLYQDVVTALSRGGKREFALSRVDRRTLRSVFERIYASNGESCFRRTEETRAEEPFQIGINDDVTFTSIPFDRVFSTEPDDQVRAVFWGLGADGTVSANKNSIKIIGEETANYAQGYFVYDSKKSGAMTVSHLRFGPRPIKSTYLIQRANFIAVHQFSFFSQYNVLESAVEGATLLLNSPYEETEVWDHLPRPFRKQSSRND